MASTSSSSSSSSHIYIPSCYQIISNEQLESIKSIYGRKDDAKESDADKRELRISTAASEAIMSCVPSTSVTTSAAVPIRILPTATTLPPVEVWDLTTAPERVISSISGDATPIRHNPTKLASPSRFQTCFDHLQTINKFFLDTFHINLVQTASKTIQVKINKTDLIIDGKISMNNAAWHPVDECVYVTHRDASIFSAFETNLGIIAHEFGHAMIHYSSRFDYQNQSGSLHEHGADVIGIMTKHRASGQLAGAADTDWRIGEGAYIAYPTHAFRSMSRPGTAYLGDHQPDHMRNYILTEKDNGGVHDNCGIPNKAFYLAASGLGGNSWERAGMIWVTALQEADQYETFEMFSQRTASVTKRLYGEREFDIVKKSWYDVGVCTRDWEMIRTHKQKIFHDNQIMKNIKACEAFNSQYPISNCIEILFDKACWKIKDFCRQKVFRELELVYSPIRLNIDGLSVV